jgi:Tol biopolymer transport system component
MHLRKRSPLTQCSLLVLSLFAGLSSLSSSVALDSAEKQSTAMARQGSSIAFIAVRYQDDGLRTSLFTVNLDGSDRRELTSSLDIIPSESSITDLVQSPDGQRLAFAHVRPNGAYAVYAVNVDGSGLMNLFSDDNCSIVSAHFNAVWSADSQKLIFERTCSSSIPKTEYRTELYVSNATVPHSTQLIRDWIQSQSNEIESNVAISPNGNQAVFFEDQVPYRMNTDGTGLVQLTEPSGSNSPSYTTFIWSPDSTRIARVDQYLENPEYQQIYVLDVDGKLLNQATNRRSLGSIRLEWSPDSTRLAYYQQESPNAPITQGNIYLLDASGGAPRNLTRQQDSYVGISWSPDGEQIASVTFGNDPRLYIINADGSGLSDMTPDFPSIFLFPPMWSFDGQQLAFTAFERKLSSFMEDAPVFSLYVMHRDGSKLTRLNDDRDWRVGNFIWQP